MLVFTRERRMAVQVMYREPQVAAAAGPRLIVWSSDPKEVWRVAWEHYQAG